MTAQITIRGARLHNLKNLTVAIPKNQLVVLTGLSGSGKSTLGFDILHKEGQRQYMESLGMVAYGLAKPPVDAITGLSPSISVDQHLTNKSPRSTVGTTTEVYTFQRLVDEQKSIAGGAVAGGKLIAEGPPNRSLRSQVRTPASA